jgi:hypothetical protein
MSVESIAAALGIAGRLPSLAGQFGGALLVMGGAACVRDDLLSVDAGWRGARMAVNDIGAHYHSTIDHWVTLHPDYMPGWHRFRMGHNYGDRGHVFTHSDRPAAAIQHAWPIANVGGSSGLFACFVGLLLGYSEIVLAGVPCDNQPHYFDPLPSYRGSLDDPATALVWQWARDSVFQGRVKSLSGRTRGWLGAPSFRNR